jgi:hypothetical protein
LYDNNNREPQFHNKAARIVVQTLKQCPELVSRARRPKIGEERRLQ